MNSSIDLEANKATNSNLNGESRIVDIFTKRVKKRSVLLSILN